MTSTTNKTSTTGVARRLTGFAGPVAAAGLLVLAGCAEQPQAGADPAGADPAAGAQVYQVTATVLEAPGTGPQLCHAAADSYPPQCGGPEIVGWDWDAVEAESAQGTTWGSYRLAGTWDGQRFTLTEPPEPPQPDAGGGPPPGGGEPDFTSPCPEPDGGWQPVDPDTATQEALDAALTLAAGDPGYAGSWVDQSYLDQEGTQRDSQDQEQLANDPARLVLNLRFTGDLAEREQSIRQVWGGALCVTGAEHTEAALRDIQQRLHADLPDTVLSSGVDTLTNTVTAQVFVADPALQQELDQQYGEGTVTLQGWLQPVR